MKSKSRPEPLCLSYFQYLYQQLCSENELGISFQMSFVSLDWKHRRKLFQCSHQPFLVGENFEKYIQLEYDETQIIDEKTGNEFFFEAEVQIQKASKKPQRLLDPICSSQEAKPRLLMKRLTMNSFLIPQTQRLKFESI